MGFISGWCYKKNLEPFSAPVVEHFGGCNIQQRINLCVSVFRLRLWLKMSLGILEGHFTRAVQSCVATARSREPRTLIGRLCAEFFFLNNIMCALTPRRVDVFVKVDWVF